MRTVICPTCGGTVRRVMYASIPAWLCGDESCSTLFGVGSWLIVLLPFNGAFIEYPPGRYWRALWSWLTDWDDEDAA